MLVEEMGTQVAVAEVSDTSPSMISQVITEHRRMGTELCEKIERGTGKPDGWLDQWLPTENPYDGTFMTEDEAAIVRLVRGLPPERRSHLMGWLELEKSQQREQAAATVHVINPRPRRFTNGG